MLRKISTSCSSDWLIFFQCNNSIQNNTYVKDFVKFDWWKIQLQTQSQHDYIFLLLDRNRIPVSKLTRKCGVSWRVRNRQSSFLTTKRELNVSSKATSRFWWSQPCSISSSNVTVTSPKLVAFLTRKAMESEHRKVSFIKNISRHRFHEIYINSKLSGFKYPRNK